MYRRDSHKHIDPSQLRMKHPAIVWHGVLTVCPLSAPESEELEGVRLCLNETS